MCQPAVFCPTTPLQPEPMSGENTGALEDVLPDSCVKEVDTIGPQLPFLDRPPSSQIARPFGGLVRGFRQRPANWGSVLVHRFSTSEGTLISASPAI